MRLHEEHEQCRVCEAVLGNEQDASRFLGLSCRCLCVASSEALEACL